MAEIVQMRLEKWSPILGEAINIGLLNTVETMAITIELQKWETTMQQSTRSLTNVLGYVQYQTGILKKLERRREELGITEKTFEIETGIKIRIRSLYDTYESNYFNQVDYWHSLVAFNIDYSSVQATIKCFQNAYRRVGKQCPSLYEGASSFVWNQEKKDIETARQILHEGVRNDEKNLDFYLWIYELELKHAFYLVSKHQYSFHQESLDEVSNCVKASRVAYQAAINFCWNVKDCTVKLYTSFLEIAYKYPQFQSLSSEIMRDLERNCSDQEATYIQLAEMEFLTKNNLEECIAKLEKGTNIVKTKKMYDLAIHYLMELLEDGPLPFIYSKLHTMLNNGLEKDAISRQSFAIWFNMFLSKYGSPYTTELFSDKEEREVVPLASSKYSDDIEFLLEVLKIKMHSEIWSSKDVDETIVTISKTTHVQSLSEKEKKQFERTLYGYVVSCIENYVDKFDKNALAKLRKIINPLLSKNPIMVNTFVRLIKLRGGSISAFRRFFAKNNLPPSYELMRTYAEVEFKNIDYKLEPEIRYSPFREMMEKACLSYGKKRTDVWIDYIKFEKSLKNDKAMSDIYNRGLKEVDKSMKKKLEQKYNELLADPRIVDPMKDVICDLALVNIK